MNYHIPISVLVVGYACRQAVNDDSTTGGTNHVEGA